MNYKDKQKKIISPLVANSLPLSVRKDYDSSVSSRTGRSIFADFIQAYYEFIEREVADSLNDFKDTSINTFKYKTIASIGPQSGGPYNITNRLPALRDFDTTLKSLRVYIRNEYLPNIPESFEGNLNNLLRIIRDVYQSKGTEIAYKTLFRYIWNESVKLTDTASEIFRPSDNNYHIDKVMRIKKIGGADSTTDENYSSFKDNYVVGAHSGSKCLVNSISQFYSGSTLITELSLDESTLDGTFLAGEEVFAQTQNGVEVPISGATATIRAKNVPGISSISISNPGTGYVIGDPITITSSTGSNASLRVKNTTTGPVEVLLNDSAGHGYTTSTPELSFSSAYIDIYTSTSEGKIDSSYTLVMNNDGSGNYLPGELLFMSSGTISFGDVVSWASDTRTLVVNNVRGYFFQDMTISGTSSSASATLNSFTVVDDLTNDWKDSDIYPYIQNNNYNATTSKTLENDGTIGTSVATANVIVKAFPLNQVSEVSNGLGKNVWRIFIDEITGTFSVGDYCRLGKGDDYVVGRIVNVHNYHSKPVGTYTINNFGLQNAILQDGGAGYRIPPQPYIHWTTLSSERNYTTSTVSNGNFVVGTRYKITAINNTDFTVFGASEILLGIYLLQLILVMVIVELVLPQLLLVMQILKL